MLWLQSEGPTYFKQDDIVSYLISCILQTYIYTLFKITQNVALKFFNFGKFLSN